MLGDHEKKWIPFRQVSGEDEDLSALGVPLDAVVKVDVGTRSWEFQKAARFLSLKNIEAFNPLISYSITQFLNRFGGSAGELKKVGLTSSSV